MLTPQQIKDIEEKFEENFPISLYDESDDSGIGFCRNKEIKSFIITTINNILAETEKAFGGCKLCYGKGYATVKDSTKYHADFIGDRSYVKENNPVKPCTCDRGKQIEKIINIK